MHMKIGIMGGTFDPIHYGHLAIAEWIRDNSNFDKVIFIPSGNPPHKKNTVAASCQERYDMVNYAIQQNSFFSVSDIEVHRQKLAYSYETLQLLKDNFKHDSLVFIIGSDTLFDLHNWKNFDKVAALCSFTAAYRSGYGEKEIVQRQQYLMNKYGADIELVSTPLIEISSTMIRERVYENKSIRYLTPYMVCRYIYAHELYKPTMG